MQVNTSNFKFSKLPIAIATGFLILLYSNVAFAQRVTNINEKGTKLTTGNIVTESATAPTTPAPIQGDVWFDTANNLVKTYDGSTWKTVASFDPDDLKDDQNLSVAAGEADTSIIDMEDGNDVTLQAGTGITLAENTTTNTITITGQSGSDDQNLSVAVGEADTSIIDMEDGNDVTLEAGTGITLTEDTTTNTITITGQSGSDDQTIETFSIDDATQVLTLALEADGQPDRTVDLTNAIAAGETDTSLEQNTTTGVITYMAEDGLADTANVVSAATNNALTVGADGGAFISTASVTDDQNLSVTAGTGTTSIIDIEGGNDVTIQAGTGLTIAEDTGTGTITITNSVTNTDDQNLSVTAGTGTTSIIDIEGGNDVTLQAGTGITLTETGNTITITGQSGSDDQNLSVTAGGTDTSIIDIEGGNDVTLQAGTGITLAETGNTITISGQSGSDDQNLSVAAGASDTSIIDIEGGTDVTIKAGTGITLTETGNTITIQGTEVVTPMVFSAEYAGASFQTDGTNNIGFMTSGNAGAANRWMNFYHWENTLTDGGTNDYDIILRFTLPHNFVSWEANAIVIDYSGTLNANFTANVYLESSGTAQASLGATTGPGNIGTWSTATIGNTGLTLGAGDTGVIVLKVTATDVATAGDSAIRLGDITLNYKSTQ